MESKTLLIIHKDDHARREIHHLISHFDFNLVYADDGLHGLYAAKSEEPDLIICDVNIQVINGVDMCEMIRKEETLKDVPVIFLHEELDFEYLNKARGIEATAFLIRPYLDNSLIYAIKRSLREDNLHINKNRSPLKYEDCKVRRLLKV